MTKKLEYECPYCYGEGCIACLYKGYTHLDDEEYWERKSDERREEED